jgi:hypothetical protein
MKYIFTHLFKVAIFLLIVAVLYEVATDSVDYYYSLELAEKTPTA